MIRNALLALALFAAIQPIAALAQASAAIAAGRAAPSPLAPSEIAAQAPKADWQAIAPADLLVMDLVPVVKGKPRRVVIQLLPPSFAQTWVGNVRKLAAARFWDGLSINRVQDNYVVQWGDANGEDKTKARPLPAGLAATNQADYAAALPRVMLQTSDGKRIDPPRFPAWTGGWRDTYAADTGFVRGGWPAATDGTAMWPVHCYGMVGVGRDMPPDAGSGAELYTVIGHAPRHLDRNIALVGRVIEGIEHLSSLPRGHGALGFYDLAQGDRRVPIRSVRLGTEVTDLPAYEVLSTDSASFALYAQARANRRDPFFIQPAGGADICNIPVPVRRAK